MNISGIESLPNKPPQNLETQNNDLLFLMTLWVD